MATWQWVIVIAGVVVLVIALVTKSAKNKGAGTSGTQ